MRDVTDNLSTDSPADVVGILDDLQALTSPVPGPPCAVRKALELIAVEDEKIAGKVSALVVDDRVPATGVADVLAKRTGVQMASQTVRRHRRRGTPSGCRCPR